MSTVGRVQEGTLLTMLGPDDESMKIFATSVTTYQSTRYNIPEDLNFGIFAISESGRAY
jgi:hypothetical protein